MAYGGYGAGGYGAGGYGYNADGTSFQGSVPAAQGIANSVVVQSRGKEEEQIFDTRKMFVGCVKKTTAEETFLSFFSDFGEVEKASLKKSYDGSGHRGFGFVIYKDQAVTDSVMALAGHLVLDGRKLNVELAIPSNMKPPEGVDSTKLFIGNLPKDGIGPATEELTEYFSQFGEVESSFVSPDKGFGFVTFKNEIGAYKALAHGLKNGQGHAIRENVILETKWPDPKPKPVPPMTPMAMGYNMYGGGLVGASAFPVQGGYAGGGGYTANIGFGFPGGGLPTAGNAGGLVGIGGFAGTGGVVGANGYGGTPTGRFQPY